MKKWLVMAIVMTAGLVSFSEDVAPFQLGLLGPDFSLEPSSTRINGWVTGFWSESPQSALSTSWFNGSTGDSKGLQIGLLNYADSYSGAQFAGINWVSGDFSGWQAGAFNYVRGTCEGFQSGIYNLTTGMRGLQLGVFNSASEMHGVQIGLVNIIASNALLTELPEELSPGMLFVNWSF